MTRVAGAIIMTEDEWEAQKEKYVHIGMKIASQVMLECNQKSNLLTIKQVAGMMGKATNTVSKWANDKHPKIGKTPFFHDGVKWAITEYDYLQMIEKIKSI